MREYFGLDRQITFSEFRDMVRYAAGPNYFEEERDGRIILGLRPSEGSDLDLLMTHGQDERDTRRHWFKVDEPVNSFYVEDRWGIHHVVKKHPQPEKVAEMLKAFLGRLRIENMRFHNEAVFVWGGTMYSCYFNYPGTYWYLLQDGAIVEVTEWYHDECPKRAKKVRLESGSRRRPLEPLEEYEICERHHDDFYRRYRAHHFLHIARPLPVPTRTMLRFKGRDYWVTPGKEPGETIVLIPGRGEGRVDHLLLIQGWTATSPPQPAKVVTEFPFGTPTDISRSRFLADYGINAVVAEPVYDY